MPSGITVLVHQEILGEGDRGEWNQRPTTTNLVYPKSTISVKENISSIFRLHNTCWGEAKCDPKQCSWSEEKEQLKASKT